MSKFSAVFQSRQENSPPQSFEPPITKKTQEGPTAKVAVAMNVAKLGRPRAKRSDPNFCQVTAYVREETYNKVRISLLTSKDKRDFSELVEDLLTKFLTT